MFYTEVATINKTIERAKQSHLGITETALRRWVKDGLVPAVYVGNKALIYWPTLIEFLSGNHNVGESGVNNVQE